MQNQHYDKPNCKLISNYHQLNVKPGKQIYALKITTEPLVDQTNKTEEEMKQIENQIIKAMKKPLFQKFEHGWMILNNKIYTSFDNMENQSAIVSEVEENIDGVERKILVTFEKVIDPSDATYSSILGRFFRMCMRNLSLQMIQRKFFDPTKLTQIKQKQLQLFQGYEISSSIFVEKMLINIDSCFKVVRSDSALQIIEKLKDKANAELKNKIIMALYSKPQRFYKVIEIKDDMTPLSTFTAKEKEISYLQYYQERYGIQIKNQHQPLIHAQTKRGKGKVMDIYLIPELCSVTGLTDEMRNDFHLMKEMSETTKPTGGTRIKQSQTLIEKLTEDNKKRFDSWGIELSKQPFELNYRVLRPGNMIMENGSKNLNLRTANLDRDTQCGIFNSQNLKLQKTAIFYEQNCQEAYSKLNEEFVQCAKSMRLEIQTKGFCVNGRNPQSWINIIQEACGKNPNNLDFAVCILNGRKKKGQGYDEIKRFLIKQFPISSQMILADTINKGKNLKSIIFKLYLQMAAKAQGIPWAISDVPFSNSPTMVMGLDVFHAPDRKSIMAIVASQDKNFGRYYSDVRIQDEGQEIATSLRLLFEEAILMFARYNRVMPRNIIVYRDGVSKGQQDAVKQNESDLLLPAFKSAQAQTPLASQDCQIDISYIIVNKRVNAKFYECQGDDIFKSKTCESGTLVEESITTDKDFYIVAQKVRQGIANPTHYHIIDSTHSKEQVADLKMLTFKLCHLHFNLAGAIKIPAPCHYAHILANFVGDRYNIKQEDSLIIPHAEMKSKRILYFI